MFWLILGLPLWTARLAESQNRAFPGHYEPAPSLLPTTLDVLPPVKLVRDISPIVRYLPAELVALMMSHRYEGYQQRFQRIFRPNQPSPTYYIPGNHDVGFVFDVPLAVLRLSQRT